MFQSLRNSNPIYILHKSGNLSLETGTVVSVTAPMPKYQVPPVFGQPQEMVVDLVVNVLGQDTNYQKLPATADIADFGNGGVVISDSREAMNAEVLALKQKSLDVITSREYHEGRVAQCDKILSDLNPEFAEKQAQQAEINELKKQMSELVEMNRQMMEQLKGSGASPKTKKEL